MVSGICMWVCPYIMQQVPSLSHFGVCCCFLEQETLLTLLQSTQLLNGDLVSAVKSMGTWGSKCPTVCLVVLGSLWNFRFYDLYP